MDASHGAMRDISIDTVKRDIVALQDALDHVRRQSMNVIERQIVNQPFESVLASFALGFIVSRLVARRLF